MPGRLKRWKQVLVRVIAREVREIRIYCIWLFRGHEILDYTLFLYKNIAFPVQVESVYFRLN